MAEGHGGHAGPDEAGPGGRRVPAFAPAALPPIYMAQPRVPSAAGVGAACGTRAGLARVGGLLVGATPASAAVISAPAAAALGVVALAVPPAARGS